MILCCTQITMCCYRWCLGFISQILEIICWWLSKGIFFTKSMIAVLVFSVCINLHNSVNIWPSKFLPRSVCTCSGSPCPVIHGSRNVLAVISVVRVMHVTLHSQRVNWSRIIKLLYPALLIVNDPRISKCTRGLPPDSGASVQTVSIRLCWGGTQRKYPQTVGSPVPSSVAVVCATACW